MMKRSAGLLALLIGTTTLAGCSKKESKADATTEAAKDAKDAASEKDSSSPAAPAEGATASARRKPQSFTWADLKGAGMQAGLMDIAALNAWGDTLVEKIEVPKSAAKEAPEDVEVPSEDDIETPQLAFARLSGDETRFCGTLKSGPIKCWGGTDDFRKIGAFVDAAATKKTVCGVNLKKKVTCMPAIEAATELNEAKRIWAGGGQFCSLGFSGKVSCFAASGESVQAPEDLKARYLGVGDGFACAANEARELQCFGEIAELALPETPLAIKDLAAGDDFVCVLDSDSQVKCFGKAPAAPEGKAKGLAAAFDTLCWVKEDGSGECQGAVKSSWSEKVKRFAVSKVGVCASLESGLLSCCDASGGDIEAPKDTSALDRARAEAQNKQNQAKYAANIAEREHRAALSDTQKKLQQAERVAFLKLFSKGSLPADFGREGSFEFGDRVPNRFDRLLGAQANNYLAGQLFELESGAVVVTAFELHSSRAVLWTVPEDGSAGRMFVLTGFEASEAEEGSEKSGLQKLRTIKSREALLTKKQLETTLYEGSEDTQYVAKHRDGSMPISRITCLIKQLRQANSFKPSGKIDQKALSATDPGVSRSHASKGCESWPFAAKK